MQAAKRKKLNESPTPDLSTDDSCTSENNHAENVEVDERGKEVSEYCLGLPTILRKILEQLSTQELKRASHVNKLWNFEARSVMKERGNISANLSWSKFEQDDDNCQRLLAFSSILENMRVVPFSGIRLFMSHRSHCRLISNEPLQLHPSYQVILDRLPWKHFSVRFTDDWKRCKDCPALALVQRILEDYSGVLEHLTLGFGQERFLRSVLQDRSLPRLKSLAIESRASVPRDELLTSNFIKTLVTSAPNLEELRSDGTIDLTFNVLKGSSAVLVHRLKFCPLVTPICEGLVGSIRATEMEIFIQTQEMDPELLNSFIPKLLCASRTTLETLVVDFLFTVPLMCYGICFEKVTKLEIHMNCPELKGIEPSIRKLPTGLDFTRVFPKLKSITIRDKVGGNFSADLISAFIEEGNAVLGRALPDRAINIKIVGLNQCSSLEESTLALLAQMFPNVKNVCTKWDHKGGSVALLRKHFLGLEELLEHEQRKFGVNRWTLKRGWTRRRHRGSANLNE